MMERMLEPAFLQEDFDRIKSQRMESLMQSRKSGPSLATRALSAVLAGPTHPLSYPRGGLPSTLAEITLDDVKAFYAAHIPAHLSGVLVSTSLPQEDVLAALTGLAELEVTESFREAIDELPKTEGRVIYLVNKDEAAQSSLRIAHPSLTYDALGNYFRAGLMNFTLGGTFDSRINLNLREDKGYSYGAYSRFTGGPELGLFRVSTEVNKEATTASINEVLTELENYSTDGMTEEEYEYMQSAIGQRDAMRYETPGAKLGLLSQAMRYDLPLDYRKRQNTVLRETDRETLNGLAGQLIDPQNIAIVVVGDAAVLRPELEAMGMPIKELDEDGFPLD
jgi:zinc protease